MLIMVEVFDQALRVTNWVLTVGIA